MHINKKAYMVVRRCYSILLSSLMVVCASDGAQPLQGSVVIDIPIIDIDEDQLLTIIRSLCINAADGIMVDWQENYNNHGIMPNLNPGESNTWCEDRILGIYHYFDDVISKNNDKRSAHEKASVALVKKNLGDKYAQMDSANYSVLCELEKIRRQKIFNRVFNGILLGGFAILAYALHRYDKAKNDTAKV